MPKIDPNNWVLKIITSPSYGESVGVQRPGGEPVVTGRRQAAKLLLQHACANDMIYTEARKTDDDRRIVVIFIYEKLEES
ncbi:MAG: hypothetical protein KAS32_08375 [Candidatus Peribacteraceae bacterium]|nr:hypothetical protein [Candidatus Peribacteraceae bacterium]